MTGTSSVY